MKTEGTLIYHKITVATGLLQNNAYGNELVLFCLIIPCARCLFMFYFYKKCKWLFWFCIHRHRSMRSIAQSIDRTVIDPCIRIECKVRSWVVFSSDIERWRRQYSCYLFLSYYFCIEWKWLLWFYVYRDRSIIDRSINRSVVIKAPYALTTKSDLFFSGQFFSPVTSSDEDITIFRGYYCK